MSRTVGSTALFTSGRSTLLASHCSGGNPDPFTRDLTQPSFPQYIEDELRIILN